MSAQIIKFEKRDTPAKTDPVKTSNPRFEALDVLRGLCVIGMILVNNAGDWQHIYPQLDHAQWHGFTLADLVFPGFLVCVGVSMALSFGRPPKGDKRLTKAALMGRTLRRSVMLIVLGLVLNAFPDFDLTHLRIPGVLQRIGLCYGLTSALVLWHSRVGEDGRLIVHARPLALWATGLLIGYGALLRFVPVPGFENKPFDSVGSWPAYIDRMVFGADHMWLYATTAGQISYDPEGILSTFPALFNVLIGVLAGLLLTHREARSPIATLAMAGFFLMVVGIGLDGQIPIIKKLWTSSFALLSTGFTLSVFALLILLIDRIGWKRWAGPAKVFGSNAILAYALSWVVADVMAMSVPYKGGTGDVASLLFSGLQSAISDPYAASFAFAVSVLVVLGLVLTPFYHKRWFLKI